MFFTYLVYLQKCVSDEKCVSMNEYLFVYLNSRWVGIHDYILTRLVCIKCPRNRRLKIGTASPPFFHHLGLAMFFTYLVYLQKCVSDEKCVSMNEYLFVYLNSRWVGIHDYILTRLVCIKCPRNRRLKIGTASPPFFHHLGLAMFFTYLVYLQKCVSDEKCVSMNEYLFIYLNSGAWHV